MMSTVTLPCIKCEKIRDVKFSNTLRPQYTGLCDVCNRKSHSGENNPNWKGGRRYSNGEYWAIHKPDHPRAHNGRVLEHILVAEGKLGRYLRDDEVVHHIDGNKKNNNPDNLEIMTQPEHAKLHDINKHTYEKIRRMVAEEIFEDIETPELLEVGRKAIEKILIEWRDSRLSEFNRGNGLVIREKDGKDSSIIRFGPETALRIGLKAMKQALKDKYLKESKDGS